MIVLHYKTENKSHGKIILPRTVNVSDPVLTGPDVIYLDGKVTGLKITGGNGSTVWSSKDSRIIQTDAKGRIKGISAGTTTITAVNNGKPLTKDIQVCRVPRFTAKSYTMNTRDSLKDIFDEAVITAINDGRVMNQVITVYNTPKFDRKTYVTNLDRPVTVALTKDPEMTGVEYSVSNTKTATIDRSGLVTPLKTGSVTVSAKIAGVTYKTTVKIYNPVINGKDTVKKGKTLGFSVKNGFGPTTWSSSDTSIATVDSKGKVKGIAKGKVIITAVNNGRTMTKVVIVE